MQEDLLINFIADKLKISGPRIDGTYTITLEVGEYMYDEIKDAPKLNGGNINVIISDKNYAQTKERN